MGAKAKNNCQLVGGGRKKEREGERVRHRESCWGWRIKCVAKYFARKMQTKTAKIEKCEGGVDDFGACVCVFVGGPSSLNIICGKVEIECRLK